MLALDFGGFLAGAENSEAVLLKEVDDAVGERLLRPDDGKVDAVVFGEFKQPGVVLGFNIEDMGYFTPCRRCRGRRKAPLL